MRTYLYAALARFEGGGTTSGVLTSASAMSVTSGERAVLDVTYSRSGAATALR